MKTRRWLLAVISSTALTLISGSVQSPAAPTLAADAVTRAGGASGGDEGDRDRHPQPPPSSQSLCQPGTPPNAPQTTQFFDNNPQLGPAQLPTAPSVGPLLAGYQRFGALTESEFLAQYTTGNPATYVYPPANGFVIAPDGKPIKQRQTLLAGYRLDRFGFPGGAFLAPLGTPFGSRSLTPQSLNTPAKAPLANYHVYCVLKPFAVDSGPIAPWFAQPGMGTQFQLNPAYLPEAGGNLNVTWLLQHNYVVEENLTVGPCPPSQPSTRQSSTTSGSSAGTTVLLYVC